MRDGARPLASGRDAGLDDGVERGVKGLDARAIVVQGLQAADLPVADLARMPLGRLIGHVAHPLPHRFRSSTAAAGLYDHD